LESVATFRLGTVLIGFGGGLFAVGMLTAVMELAAGSGAENGIALGAWGAVQATAMGLAVGTGGAVRDLVSNLSANGHLGPLFADQSVAYGIVYQIEIVLLFATLIVIGPLVRYARNEERHGGFGLAEMPV
ncbi:MAG: MFS transporter, partial [Hyphomicrobiales bacterium]